MAKNLQVVRERARLEIARGSDLGDPEMFLAAGARC